MVEALWRIGSDIGFREADYRITTRFEEQKDLLAIGAPGAAETHVQSAAQWFDE